MNARIGNAAAVARKPAHSMALLIAGIPQAGPLSPNGRVFQRLSRGIPPFEFRPDGTLRRITREEAFLIRVIRWLPPAVSAQIRGILELGVDDDVLADRARRFVRDREAWRKDHPAPWESDN